MAPSKTIRELALKLSREIAQSHAEYIEPITAIARRHGVSYPTAHKAVHLLIEQGMLKCHPGKRYIQIVTPSREPTTEPILLFQPGIRSTIALDIKAKILHGTYPVKEPLPKIAFLCNYYGASAHTILAVLRDLDDINLVHKKGSRWIAGSKQQHDPGLSAGSSRHKVVVALFDWQADWLSFHTDFFTRSFAEIFTQEIQRCGYTLSLAFRRETDPNLMVDLPRGMQQVHTLIDNLGESYAGTLMFPHPEADPEILDTLNSILRYKKPLVLVDSAGHFSHIKRSVCKSSQRFYRAFLNEDAAATMVVQSLISYGHKIVGLPVYDHFPGDWPERRANILERIAKQTGILTIKRVRLTEPFWDLSLPQRMHHINYVTDVLLPEITQQLDGAGKQHKGIIPLKKMLLTKIASLAPLLEDSSVTALIGCNETYAREFYFLCKSLGIDVPKRMSIVGFDNQTAAVPFPVSTVDFGFGQLGYRAAHALMGDTPIQNDREGAMAGICTLIQKGSLAAALGSAFL